MKLRPENEMLVMILLGVIIVLAVVTLCGCSARPVQVISGCPKVTIPPEPDYPLNHIKPTDSRNVKLKAVSATIVMQRDYIHGQLLPRLREYE